MCNVKEIVGSCHTLSPSDSHCGVEDNRNSGVRAFHIDVDSGRTSLFCCSEKDIRNFRSANADLALAKRLRIVDTHQNFIR